MGQTEIIGYIFDGSKLATLADLRHIVNAAESFLETVEDAEFYVFTDVNTGQMSFVLKMLDQDQAIAALSIPAGMFTRREDGTLLVQKPQDMIKAG